jgi:hypothetical protein
VYIRSCAMVPFEIRNSKVESRKSKFEIRNSKVESRKSKVESRKKRCYTHFCDVKVDTTLRFPGFYPPIFISCPFERKVPLTFTLPSLRFLADSLSKRVQLEARTRAQIH